MSALPAEAGLPVETALPGEPDSIGGEAAVSRPQAPVAARQAGRRPRQASVRGRQAGIRPHPVGVRSCSAASWPAPAASPLDPGDLPIGVPWPDEPQRGKVQYGKVQRDETQRGEARRGEAQCSEAQCDETRRGEAQRGAAGYGKAGSGSQRLRAVPVGASTITASTITAFPGQSRRTPATPPAPVVRRVPVARPLAPAAQPSRVRLTRRGRLALTAGGVLTMSLLWFAAASAAHAADRGAPAVPGTHTATTQIVVQPGQTLWSIAAQADPGADPRAVIQQIVTANKLTTENLTAGQHLWVPRG